ncbi:myotubularin-related protein 3 isoform X2 [Eurosta solidaginis]|uniref:myotubularin-related protein 3 isoform X2 n=1 Tax=Eurosta solidaginis TaxID=178769 RepID=UPI0035314B45
MEGSDGSPPPSLCIVRAAEFFPKLQMEKEDTQLMVPFQELAGESVKYLGRTDDGVLALSTYRIFMLKNSANSETSVPLGLIENVQTRDLFHLIINCKDASTVKCSFETAEQCAEWQRRIQLSVGVPETLESLFAFPFHSYMCDTISVQNNDGVGGGGCDRFGDGGINNSTEYLERLQRAPRDDEDFMREVERLGFDLNGAWRISKANEEFKLCPSYPQKLLVPGCISDQTLNEVANFRGSRRLPAVVWRHRKSGAVIARCSQPEVGWFGWRSRMDEQLLKAIADACAFDRGEQMRRQMQTTSCGPLMTSGESSPSSADVSHEEVMLDEKILIVDARSYASAVTNRARGGGCECIEYYPCAEIEFMNLGNIHVIRRSFQALRQLCASPPDCPNWLSLLEKTMWLQHLSGLLAATVTVCHAIEKKGRPVLVHCSDGWDRTPQIVATAQLCLDPFYRTVEGFRVLVEREWLSFGHKFSDRCGHGPESDELNERCPVFLQWLDLVHQIHKQFPCSFEFNMAYLIKLAQHSNSCLFGTFLCNTYKERLQKSVFERTFSVWPFLSGPMYKNPLYIPNRDTVIWPVHHVRDLYLWTDVYLGSLGNQNNTDCPNNSNENLQETMSPLIKTRSYGDLISANIIQNGLTRRSSDPNMVIEPNLNLAMDSGTNFIADTHSEREDTPDNVNETIQKIQNLTMQLNHHDEMIFMNVRKAKNEWQKHDQTETGKHAEYTAKNIEDSAALLISCQTEEFDSTKDIQNDENPNNMEPQIMKLNENARHSLEATAVRDSGSNNHLKTYTECIRNNMVMNIDLSDASCNVSAAVESDMDSPQNVWHGSANTSTDTLVPVERRKASDCQETNTNINDVTVVDVTDSFESPEKLSTRTDKTEPWLTSPYDLLRQERKSPTRCNLYESSFNANGVNSSILPKVHGNGNTSNRLNILSNSSSNASVSSSSYSVNNLDNSNKTNISNKNEALAKSTKTAVIMEPSCDNKVDNDTESGSEINANGVANPFSTNSHVHSSDSMNESIIILPEHRKLEISVSGKCETVSNNGSSLPTTPTRSAAILNGNVSGGQAGRTSTNVGLAAQRRRRTSSSNSNPNRSFDGCNIKLANGSTTTRFSLPGARSLPMTPPAQPERPQITISCPDGLAHALSEQNLRLQQIVLEHKVREDVLLREIHEMRMALLKKLCPNCNVAQTNTNDDQVYEFSIRRRRIIEFSKYQSLKARSRTVLKHLQKHQKRQQQKLSQQQSQKRRKLCLHRHQNAIGQHDSLYMRYRCRPCLCLNSQNQRRRHHSFSCSYCFSNQDGDFTYDNNDVTLALLTQIYNYNCGVQSSLSSCTALDNIENASICSWEAVEDRSAPSSNGSSSIQQPSTTSALWVPDHAVKRCTSCQVEFWIGRRRHHCRSCGQIFCADCSEFWAPLPDAKLFNPVRLCGPCYHAVTTKIQQQSRMVNSTNIPNLITSNTISTCANITTAMNLSNSTITEVSSAASHKIDVTTTDTTTPASSRKVIMPTKPTTPASVLQQQQQKQQQHCQNAAATAGVTVAAVAAATSTQIESSSMSHMLMAANKNIAASVAN